jgi:four helix bundle protein
VHAPGAPAQDALARSQTEGSRRCRYHENSASTKTAHRRNRFATQLLLAGDIGYLQPDMHRQLDDQVNEVKRMLNSFIKTLS